MSVISEVAASRPQPVAAESRLTRAAFLNALSALLDFGSQLVVALVVTPVLLRSLDSALFGVWKVLLQLVDYMAAADGRPTQAVKWVIANEQHADDLTKRRTVTSAHITYLVYLPLLLVVGGVLVWLAPTFTRVPAEDAAVVRIACGLLVLNFLVAGLAQLPAAALRGENQGYRRMGLAAGLTLLGAVLTVAAARLGLGLVGIAAAQVLIAMSTAVFFSLVVKRYLPWYGFSRPSWTDVRRFLSFSNWFFISVIVNRLLFATDVVILGVLTAPTVVTVYVVTGFASLTTVGLIAAIVGAIMPGLGGLMGLRQHERASALRAEMSAYSWLLATVIGTVTLLLNRSFIHLWVGLGGRYAGSIANLLIVLLAVQLVFIRNDAYVIDLSLDLRRKIALGLTSAAVSTALAWLLIPSFGIVGMCVALLLGRTILTVSYPILVHRYFGALARLSLTGLLRQGVVMATLFAVAAIVGDSVLLSNWLVWVVAATLATIATASVCFGAGFTSAQRTQALRRVHVVGAYGRT